MPNTEVFVLIAFAAYIAVFALFRLQPRVAIVATLALVASAAITLTVGRAELANRLVIYALYFLASGTVLIIIEHVRGVPERTWLSPYLDTLKSSVARWALVVVSEAQLSDKDQMLRAMAIQDRLRKKPEGLKGAEGTEEWREPVEMVVLDASVAINWFSEKEATDKALAIRQEILDGKTKFAIPDLLLYEIANALRHDPDFGESDVTAAVQSILDMGPEIIAPGASLMEAATKLAFEHKITLDQAFYVALAHEIGANLITADEELYENIKQLKFVKLLGNGGESKGIEG